MVEGLAAMGANITAHDDGWTIIGPSRLQGARVRSHGDHRVAMALAVAGLLAEGETQIEDAECVEISYPEFFDQLESLCAVVNCPFRARHRAGHLRAARARGDGAARGLRAGGRAGDAGGQVRRGGRVRAGPSAVQALRHRSDARQAFLGGAAAPAQERRAAATRQLPGRRRQRAVGAAAGAGRPLRPRQGAWR